MLIAKRCELEDGSGEESCIILVDRTQRERAMAGGGTREMQVGEIGLQLVGNRCAEVR